MKVSQQVLYQEYLHHRRTNQYSIANIDLFKPQSEKD